MASVTSGPIQLVDAMGFDIMNYPTNWDTLEYDGPEWGSDSLYERNANGELILLPRSVPLLEAGVSIVRVVLPTTDEAAGLTLSILDAPPPPMQPREHLNWAEVSVEYLEGTGAEVTVAMGYFDITYEPEIRDWRLPTGVWRVRGSIVFDETQLRDGIVGTHPESVGVTEFPTSGRSWQSLPCQLHLEFWREDELRPPEFLDYVIRKQEM